MLSLVYPSQLLHERERMFMQRSVSVTDPWLTLWRIYTTTRTEEQPHAYNDTCMIDGRYIADIDLRSPYTHRTA